MTITIDQPRIPERRARRGRRPWGWAVAAGLVALLLALPAISIAAQFLVPTGNTWQQLIETTLPDYVRTTLWLVVSTALLTFVIGVGTAWLTVMTSFPARGLLTYVLVLPLAMPAYIGAYAYADLLQPAGIVQTGLRGFTGWQVGQYWFPDIRSLPGAVFVFTVTLYPYVYLLARAAFLQQSATALDVARTLGLGPWRVFRKVALPLARPAIVGGVALVVMETLADYGAVSYLGVYTFTAGIYNAWYSRGDRIAAGQLAGVLLIAVLALLVLEKIGRRGRAIHNAGHRTQPPAPVPLRGWKSVTAFVACLMPPLLGFLVPGGSLARLLGRYDQAALFNARFVAALWSSLGLAGGAAVLTLALALLLAYARRATPGAVTKSAAGIAGYGYALPGSVIAVGILLPMTALDRTINSFMIAHFGMRTGLLITGTSVGLLFAYAVRFIAPALEAVESGFQRVTPSIVGAARTLTRGPTDALVRVHAPIIAPAALTAALIVFVDAMKELPATLLMRPFNSDTLAVLTYRYAADERLESAAAPALTIVLVGLPPLILLMRRIARRLD